MTERRFDASFILANLGCLTLMGGCVGVAGLAGYQIHKDNHRRDHLHQTVGALSAHGLEFWGEGQSNRNNILNVFSAEHSFRVLDPSATFAAIKFLNKIGYENIDNHQFKSGLHLITASTNDAVFANLATGIFNLK